MAVVSLTAWWRQFAGGVGRSSHAAVSGFSLTVVAVLLLTLALAGGGRDLVPWTAFRLVMLGLGALALLSGRLHRTALSFPLAGVLFAAAVASIGSVRPQSSMDQVIAWSTYAATFLIVASMITRGEGARRFVDAAIFIGGALSLIGLYWFWGAENPTMRWYSTFYWPNPFAGFLLLLIPTEVLRCILAGSRWEALTHGAMTVLLGTAFVLTFSRGAWVTAIVIAALTAIVLRNSLHRGAAFRTAALLLTVAAAVFMLTRGQAFRSPTASVLTRATSTADLNEYSLQGRLHFLRGAAEIFRDHPLVGTGPGTYAYVYPQYQRDVRFYAQDPHNLFAQMAAETGVVGLAALLWLMVALAAMGTRVIRAARGTQEFAWVAGAAFGLSAFWLHTGMEINWSFPAAPALAFALMGVLAWYDSRAGIPPEPSGAPAVRRGPVEGRRVAQGKLLVTRVVTTAGIVLVMVLVVVQYAATSQFRTGQVMFAAGRWQAAGDAFARASALNPIDPRYPSALADAMGKSGHPPAELIPLVRRASALDRANPFYWVQLALLSRRISTAAANRDAEAALGTAIALDPFHHPEAYGYLAALYRQRGDQAKALEVYRQAAARYPDSVAQDFVLRPRLWPDVLALFMDWAGLLVEQQRDAEAEDLYARIVRLEPRFVPANVALVRLYLKTGRLRDAARVLRAGLEHIPNDGQLQALRHQLQAISPSTVMPEHGK